MSDMAPADAPAKCLTPALAGELLGAGHNPIDLALAAWLDAKASRTGSARTAVTHRELIAAFRSLLIARGPDLDADPALIALLAQAWAGRGNPEPSTHNQRLAVLSSFYTFARRRGLLAIDNPIGRIDRRPVQGYAGATPLPYLEVKARLTAIDRATLVGKRDYALLAVALQTGRCQMGNYLARDLRREMARESRQAARPARTAGPVR